MECLNNIVGVRCAGGPAPYSGLYIEDLEGINLKTASDIADVRYHSGLDLILKKLAFAQKGVLNDIQGAFLPFFRVNTLIEELRIGEYKSTFSLPSPFQRGVKMKTRNSRLMKIRIKEVEIQIQEPDTTSNLLIKDGQEVTTYEFTTDASGNATVRTEYLSKTNEVFVVIEDDQITPRQTQLKPGCNCYNRTSEFLIGWGWNNEGQSSSTFGLIVQALAECDNEELICLMSSKIGFLILYKAGIEIVKEWIVSDRLNPVTIIDDGTEEFLLDEFERQYKKHKKTFVESVPRFMSTIDEVCVVCNQSKYYESTP